MELQDILKQVRTEIGMTQVEIAEALHLSFSTVNRWENGRARPNHLASVTILALAKKKGASQKTLAELKAALSVGSSAGKGT
ncbi:MAG: helix-turn-helix transcriptional regulator [Oscillospiraceae bacterium]